MKQPVVLRIFQNGELKGVKQFTDQQVVMGRNAGVQLELTGEEVSPLHAVIEERDAGYYLADLGSESGTKKNGDVILDSKLESGDEIKIGPYKIQFFIGVPKPVAPPVASGVVSEDSSPTPATQPKPPPTTSPPVAPPKPSAPPEEKSQPPEEPTMTNVSAMTVNDKEEPKKEDRPEDEEKDEFVATPPPVTSAGGGVVTPPTKEETKITKSPPVASSASISSSVRGTFAPPSEIQDLDRVLRPGKGTVVEVVVAWKERIISTHHFNEKGVVTVGSDPKNNIIVPMMGASHPLLAIDSLATICVTQEMSGDHIKEDGSKTPFVNLVRQGKLTSGTNGYTLQLAQGEMARIGVQGGLVSIYIRYVPEAPKPLVAPLLDLTAAEVTGVIMAVVVAAIFGLYMMVYSPTDLEDEDLVEEKLRIAKIDFRNIRPPKKELKVVEVTEKNVQKQKKSPEPKKEKKTATTPKPAKNSGAASEVRPNKNKKAPKTYTGAVKKGGGIKTGKKKAANAAPKKPDPSKQGLLGVFGSKGTQNKISQVTSGAGELIGDADSATGAAGGDQNRKGDLGGRVKDTGRGGQGQSMVGIAGVGTTGKGTGGPGLGTGGIGNKGSVNINVGGQEEEFEGSIDREAIRRVILQNKSTIKRCYDRVLNRNKDLYGKLVLQWDIIEQGRVEGTRIKSNTMGSRGGTEVARCILANLKSWKFPEPPPGQKARVSFPFVFTSQ